MTAPLPPNLTDTAADDTAPPALVCPNLSATSPRPGGALPAGEWPGIPAALEAITARIQGVLLECRPALQVIERYDDPDTMIYLDPPYVQETRSAKRRGGSAFHAYAYEMTDADHVALLDRALQAQAMIVISGYASPLYDGALRGWDRRTIETHADGALDRTEVLWINPACAAALNQKHPTLFNLATEGT